MIQASAHRRVRFESSLVAHLVFDANKVKQRKSAIGVYLEQKIDIAVRSVIATRARPEQREMGDTSRFKFRLNGLQGLDQCLAFHGGNVADLRSNRHIIRAIPVA